MPASADLTIRLAVVRPNAYRVAPASGSVWGLSNAIAEQFSDFQFPYIESTSTCRFEYGGELPLLRMSSNTVKIAGYRPRGSLQNRPRVDVSKPATESGLRQVLFYPAEVGLGKVGFDFAVVC